MEASLDLHHPSFHQQLGTTWKLSKICQELHRRQPQCFHRIHHPPVFVKEVHGNVWKTGTIDQPASEPDSYWIRIPDNSILRRMRCIFKPRSLPSHFELKAEAQSWNSEGMFHQHSPDSFKPFSVESNLPVAPMVSVTPPAMKDGTAKSEF